MLTMVTVDVPNTTQNTTSPFRGVLESPLVLNSNESKMVVVEFKPTGSGNFTKDLSLGINSNSITISAVGTAYTKEEFEEAVYQACQTSQSSGQTNAPWFEQGTKTLFYNIPCLTPEQLRQAIEFIEQDNWDLPSPVWGLEQVSWDKQKVIDAIQFLLDKFRAASNMSPTDRTAFVLGWIQQMITPSTQHYDPHFAAFHNWLNSQGVAPDFFRQLAEQGFMAALSSLPIVGPLITIIQVLIGALQTPEPPTGQISPGQAFIVALVATMNAYSDQGAVETAQALFQRWVGTSELWNALKTLVIAGSLVETTVIIQGRTLDYRAAGLTLNFYTGFLERLRAASTLNDPFIGTYLDALGKGPNIYRSNPAEDYANLMGGFMTLINLVERRWTVLAIPTAHSSVCSSAPPCNWVLGFYDLVHVIARKQVEGIGPVTAFVHVQAKLGPDEVNDVVKNINTIIDKIKANYGVWLHTHPVIVQVSFNANTSNVDQIISRIGTPAVPVVFIYVDQNGIWQAKAVCPASGCPGRLSPEEFAKKIAKEMGYEVGKKYDPLNDPDPASWWLWLFMV